MAWEKETEFVDKALGVHFVRLVNRMVTTQGGDMARFDLQIRLGDGAAGPVCVKCQASATVGLTLGADGRLVDQDGVETTPAAVTKKYVDALNDFHARMDGYIGRHRVTAYTHKAAKK
jgi:hypothetical protein